MIMRAIILILIMTEMVGAVGVNMSCPKNTQENTAFKCNLNVINGSGEYDIKIALRKEPNSIIKVWNKDKNKWQSAFYYLKNFIKNRDKKDIKLKILEKGKYDIELKLRKKKATRIFHIGVISVNTKTKETITSLGISENKGKTLITKLIKKKGMTSPNGKTIFKSTKNIGEIKKPKHYDTNRKVILLNSKKTGETHIIYVSKNWRVINWLPYVFCIFLIFLIIVLIWDGPNR